jgi:site-specific recombinase XerD
MESSSQTVSPLRQRMIEDMRMRKLMPRTREAYIRAVRKFTKFLGRSPDTATDEDLRRFQLHLIDQGTSPITLNATIVGLNFLFTVTLGRPEAMAKMQSVRVPQKLTEISLDIDSPEMARKRRKAAESKQRTIAAGEQAIREWSP